MNKKRKLLFGSSLQNKRALGAGAAAGQVVGGVFSMNPMMIASGVATEATRLADIASDENMSWGRKAMAASMPILNAALGPTTQQIDAEKRAKYEKDMIQRRDAYGSSVNYANGGQLTEFNNGGSHEMNPFGGIPQGLTDSGDQNLVEQGETKLDDYIFSDRNKVSKELVEQLGLPKNVINKTFAQASKILSEEAKERPNDAISKRGSEDALGKLRMAQEALNQSNNTEAGVNTFANGGRLHNDDNLTKYNKEVESLKKRGISGADFIEKRSLLRKIYFGNAGEEAPKDLADDGFAEYIKKQESTKLSGNEFNTKINKGHDFRFDNATIPITDNTDASIVKSRVGVSDSTDMQKYRTRLLKGSNIGNLSINNAVDSSQFVNNMINSSVMLPSQDVGDVDRSKRVFYPNPAYENNNGSELARDYESMLNENTNTRQETEIERSNPPRSLESIPNNSISLNKSFSLNGLTEDQKVVANDIINEGLKRGYSHAAIAGILGNVKNESNFNHNATGAAGEKGYLQFLGARLTDYKSRIKKGKTPVVAMYDDLEHKYNTWSKGSSLSTYKNMANAGEAAEYLMTNAIRPNKKTSHKDRRVSSASSYYNTEDGYMPNFGAPKSIPVDTTIDMDIVPQSKKTIQNTIPVEPEVAPTFSAPTPIDSTTKAAGAGLPWGAMASQAARLYPTISNIIERNRMVEPMKTRLGRLHPTYKPEFIDRELATAKVLSERDAAMGNIANLSAGDAAAARAGMLSMGAKSAGALSDTNFKIDRMNEAMRDRQAAERLNVQQFNLGQEKTEADWYDRDLGAYYAKKEQLRSATAGDIGNVGKEYLTAQQAAQAFGYDPYTGRKIGRRKVNVKKYGGILNIK